MKHDLNFCPRKRVDVLLSFLKLSHIGAEMRRRKGPKPKTIKSLERKLFFLNTLIFLLPFPHLASLVALDERWVPVAANALCPMALWRLPGVCPTLYQTLPNISHILTKCPPRTKAHWSMRWLENYGIVTMVAFCMPKTWPVVVLHIVPAICHSEREGLTQLRPIWNWSEANTGVIGG